MRHRRYRYRDPATRTAKTYQLVALARRWLTPGGAPPRPEDITRAIDDFDTHRQWEWGGLLRGPVRRKVPVGRTPANFRDHLQSLDWSPAALADTRPVACPPHHTAQLTTEDVPGIQTISEA